MEILTCGRRFVLLAFKSKNPDGPFRWGIVQHQNRRL